MVFLLVIVLGIFSFLDFYVGEVVDFGLMIIDVSVVFRVMEMF